VKRPASVRAAVARLREARLRTVERQLMGHLRYLRRYDLLAHDTLIRLLHRVVVANRAIRGSKETSRAGAALDTYQQIFGSSRVRVMENC